MALACDSKAAGQPLNLLVRLSEGLSKYLQDNAEVGENQQRLSTKVVSEVMRKIRENSEVGHLDLLKIARAKNVKRDVRSAITKAIAERVLNLFNEEKEVAQAAFNVLLDLVEIQAKDADSDFAPILERCLSFTSHSIYNDEFKCGFQPNLKSLIRARKCFLDFELYRPLLPFTLNHPQVPDDALKGISNALDCKVDFLFGVLLMERASPSLRKKAWIELLKVDRLETYPIPLKILFVQPDLPKDLQFFFLQNFTQQATKQTHSESYRLFFLEALLEWIIEWPQLEEFGKQRVECLARLISHCPRMGSHEGVKRYEELLLETLQRYCPEKSASISQFDESLFDFMRGAIDDESQSERFRSLYAKKIGLFYVMKGCDRLPSFRSVVEMIQDPKLRALAEQSLI